MDCDDTTSAPHLSVYAGAPVDASDVPRAYRGLARLMQDYLDGDPRAFRKLHALVAPRIRRQIQIKLGGETGVDDVLQATFLKAHVSRHRFEWRASAPDRTVLNWYSAIARNNAIDLLRQRGRAPHTAPVDATGSGVVPRQLEVLSQEDELLAREAVLHRIDTVRSAVRGLPDRQREVVELHKLREMPMTEIAEQLGARAGTLRVRAHRAYRMLATSLRAVASSVV